MTPDIYPVAQNGGSGKADIGRRVVSLNTNKKYAVDNSRTTRINKHTHRRMRPVIALNSKGGIKYRTYINLVGAVPETKAAMMRAERAARRRRTKKTKTKKTKTKKTKTSNKKKKASKRSILAPILPRKSKTKRRALSKTKMKTNSSSVSFKTGKLAIDKFFRIDKTNPAVQRLKRTLDNMENVRKNSIGRVMPTTSRRKR